jgi:urease accessory protein UreE
MSRFETKTEQRGLNCVEITVLREQAVHGRLKVQAPSGEEVIIDLPRGEIVHDGDTFGPSETGTCYRMKINAEEVMQVGLRDEARTTENALKLGYDLGGHHLEVLVEGDSAFLPLNIHPDKLEAILQRTGLPVLVDIVKKVIDSGSSGYFAGEDEGD